MRRIPMSYVWPNRIFLLAALLLILAVSTCSSPVEYDIVLRGGTIYDGSGNAPIIGDVAIHGDQIAAIGALSNVRGLTEIDVTGLAVAPGFVNMMCWANETLIQDGRSQSDIRQGVTMEVLGEGFSMGPLSESMKQEMAETQGDIKYEVEWTTLDEYLQFLERKGVSPNVGSFIGAASPRVYVIGYDDRPPTDEELDQMRDLVRQAMKEGALGMASSLVYPPGFFAETDELVALAEVVSEYDGLYISHLRSEGEDRRLHLSSRFHGAASISATVGPGRRIRSGP
jgi:N-acyl-D-amino-acid deacylase